MSAQAPRTLLQAPQQGLGAFEAYGIETEYVIVCSGTLEIAPAAPELLRGLSGIVDTAPAPEEVRSGSLAWSNELAAHVIELKNPRPGALAALSDSFDAEARALARHASTSGLRLMPGGMHPWMLPVEATLWPYGNSAVYQAFDRVFGCQGHGWTNLQSTHINLPFWGDEQFSRLHSAIRLVLPIIPAIAASSPFVEGERAPALDFRLTSYRHHADAVPSVVGKVIPDAYENRAQYQERLLMPLYRDIAPRDPRGVLQHEWLNARGAIARFDRSAVEIRLMDAQECPRMDIALAGVIIDAVWWLYRRSPQPFSTDRLSELLLRCAEQAEHASISCAQYLDALGLEPRPCEASAVWRQLAARLQRDQSPHAALWSEPLSFVLSRGTLASRLVRAVGARPHREALRAVYRALCDCVEQGSRFDP